MARYFMSDGINLNELGYLRLAMLLQVALADDSVSSARETAKL